MPEWITDRLPTDVDSDADGEVWIPRLPGAKPASNDCTFQHFTLVVLGQPWYSDESA